MYSIVKLDIEPTLVLASTRVDQSLDSDIVEVDEEGNRVENGQCLGLWSRFTAYLYPYI
jgi:hypothetical protein